MGHLSREQLVDLADGTNTESSTPHLVACAQCREMLAELRSTISRAARVQMPEPSPLFWDHFSARVRDAVAAEGAPEPLSWSERVRSTLFGSARVVRVLVPLAIAAAAVVVIGVFVTSGSRQPIAVAVPDLAESTIPAEAVEGTTIVLPDDPTLSLMADLGTDLDWDQIHDSGIVAHSGLMDRAVSGLSAGERAELEKLLKKELAGGGN